MIPTYGENGIVHAILVAIKDKSTGMTELDTACGMSLTVPTTAVTVTDIPGEINCNACWEEVSE